MSPVCPYCGSPLEHWANKRGEKCWVPQRGMTMAFGPWEADGFHCTAKPRCSIYPTEAIWRQRVAIANAII